MPILHIARTAPAMTQHLVEIGTFADNPLVVVDVGARGGVEPFWKVFGNDLRIIGFEPDSVECAKLNETAEKNVSYLPVALSDSVTKKTFHVAKLGAAGSFYKSEPTFNARLNIADNMVVEREVTIETTTLAAALGDLKPDFIKLDAEGAELEILRGADLGSVLGVVAEVRFGELMSGCPTFADTDVFCRAAGPVMTSTLSLQPRGAPIRFYDYATTTAKPIRPHHPGPDPDRRCALFATAHQTAARSPACSSCSARRLRAGASRGARLTASSSRSPESRTASSAAPTIGRSKGNDPMFRPPASTGSPNRSKDYDGKFTPLARSFEALQRLWRRRLK